MADVNSLLGEALGEEVVPSRETVVASVAEEKRNEVRAAAQTKMADMQPPVAAPQLNPADAYRFGALTLGGGAGRETMTPLERELSTLTPNQIQDKYGWEEGNRLIRQQLSGIRDFSADTKGNRSGTQIASDLVSGVGLGLTNAVGGIGALGLGLANPDAGVWAANQLRSLNEAVQGTQSQTLQNNRQANQTVNSLDFRDNRAQFEQEKETYGISLDANLRRIGRDVLDSVGNMISEPTLLSDGIAQGVGSLAAAGPLGKVLGAVGKAVVPQATRNGIRVAAEMEAALGNTTAATVGNRVGSLLPSSTALAIGGMEAGGAYQGTASQISGMSFEELEANSPYYREMREQGLSPEEARTRAANKAGLMAGAIAGPTGVLAGGLVSKFEGAPLRVPNIRAGAMNLARETVEEGLQGATGQLAQNIGTQQYANENLNLSEGVGEQIGTGALFGLGAAGVVQAPGIAARATTDLARAAGTAVVGAVTDRAAAVQAKNEATSPVSDAAVQGVGAQVAAAAPQTEAALVDAVQSVEASPDATPEQKTAMAALAEKIIGVNRFEPAQYQDRILPEAVKTALVGSSNRVDAVQRLADVVNKSDPATPEAMAAAVNLYELLNQYEDILYSDPAALEAIPEDHPANQIIEQFNDLGSRLAQNASVQGALAQIKGLVADKQEEIQSKQAPITVESLATPEGQTAVQNSLALAHFAPHRANLETNNQILAHATAGKIKLTQSQHAALMTSNAILQAVKTANEEHDRLGHTTPMSQVSNQVQVSPDPKAPKLSALAHATHVFESMRRGDTEGATDRLVEFRKFVQHMANKVEALNEHFALGGGKNNKPAYQALDPETREWYESKSLFEIHPNSASSVETGQQIALEANRLADIYNGLSTAFPSLKGGQAPSISLVPALQGKPQDVAQAFKSGERVRPAQKTETKKPETKSETKPETKTAAVTETVSTPQAAEATTKAAEPTTTTPIITIPEAAATTEAVATTEKQEAPKAQPKETSGTKEPAQTTGAAETTPPTKTEKQGIEAVYPGLVGSEPEPKVTNYFKQAYRLAKEAKSRLTASGTPLAIIQKAFSSETALWSFTGDRETRLSPELAKALTAYVGKGDKLVQALDARLQSFLTKGKVGERFLNGEQANRWVDGKTLNLTELNQEGKLVYNQELVESAVLAGLQWLLTADQFESKFDEGSAAALMGIPQDDVQQPLVDKLNAIEGLTTVAAKSTLTKKIKSFWGLDNNPNAPAGFVEGIAEAMAAEILETMIANGDLKVETLTIEGITNTPDFFAPTKKIEKDDPLMASLSAIERAVLVEPEDINYFGDARPKVAKLQLRSTVVANTSEQQAMIKAAQDTPHFFHQPMLDLYKALTLENILALFGAGDVENTPHNVNHAKSKDGQNRTIAGAFKQILALSAEASEKADATGVSLDQLPIHYAYNVTSVGRLQMLGRYNPQSTKLMREVLLPTKSTIDLSRESGQDYERFMLGLAQALGVKVHKVTLATSIEKTNALLQGKLAPSIELLRDFHATGKANPKLVESLKKGLGKDLSVVALHALSEYARLQETEDKSAFSTPIYVEADGVTNGPTNAMMLLSAGQFSVTWLKSMAKGGLFFRAHQGQPRTMNELHTFVPAKGGDNNDQYQTTTDNLKGQLDKLNEEISGRPGVVKQAKALSELMDILLPGYTINGKELELNRGIAKNPLTITIYGSGEKGIAGNVVSAMVETLYEKMTDAAQRQKADPTLSLAEAMFGGTAVDKASAENQMQRLISSLEPLTEQVVRRSKKKGLFVTDGAQTQKIEGVDPVKFTLEPARIQNLQENALRLFVVPLKSAITETVGQPLMDGAKLIQQATQAQSLFQKHAFIEGVRLAIYAKAVKDPEILAIKVTSKDIMEILWKGKQTQEEKAAFLKEKGITGKEFNLIQRVRNEGLTRVEADKVMQEVLKKFPLITTGAQTFFPGGSQSTDVNDTEYGRSLTGGFRTPGFVYGPSEAGVAGIPFLVIGTGDGQAIQSLVTMKGAPTNALYIFDGVNFKLTTLEDDTRKANQAIYESWQGNPIEAVSEMFEKSLSNMDLEDAPIELVNALLTLFLGPNAVGSRVTIPMELLKGTALSLSNAALSIKARHNVMARVSHSIDQMAAVSAPYENQGIQLQGTSDEAIVGELNTLLVEEEAKLGVTKPAIEPAKVEAPKVETPVAKPEVAKTKPAIEKPVTFGKLHASGARVLTYTSINKLVKALGLAPTQSAIFNQIRLAKAAKDYKVVHGTIEQLVAYADATGRGTEVLEGLKTKAGKTYGITIPSESIIYLISPSKETLVHELIHAATFETVSRVLDGRLPDPEMNAAVVRLQLLMEQFLDANDGTFQDVVSAIQGHQAALNPAAALNEFMAWGLANQKLANTLGKTQVSSPLVQLAKNVVKAIKVLFFGRSTMPKPADDMLSNLLFNTSIVVRGQPSLWSQMNETKLFMSTGFGTNERLADLEMAFAKHVASWINSSTTVADKIDRKGESDLAQLAAAELALSAISHGFSGMSPQAVSTFTSVVAGLATQAQIDPNSMVMAQELYIHVIKLLKGNIEKLMKDPNSQDPNARYEAQERYKTLTGVYAVRHDAQGRSSLLPVFLALAMVNDDFRQSLAKLPLPKNVLQGWNTLDGVINNSGTILMDKLSQNLSGTSKSNTVKEAVDALGRRIQEVTNDRRTMVDQLGSTAGGIVDRGNEILINLATTLADKAVKATEARVVKRPTKINKGIAAVTSVAAAIASEIQADKVAQGLTAAMNTVKGWEPIRAIQNDLLGRTESNKTIYDMIKTVRSYVQQARQQYREHLPTVIAAKFTRKLTDNEWTSLFRGMGKTDLASLSDTPEAIVAMLADPTQFKKAKAKLEVSLRAQDPTHWNLIQAKAKQLANFMSTGETGSNLLRNAEAVTRLLGERTQPGRSVDAAMIKAVDQLVSLYALEALSQETKDTMASLAQDQAEGMSFALAYLVGQRKDEMAKAASGRARYNHYKGHIPSTQQEGVSLIIADVSRTAELLSKSYTKVADYVGSSAEQGAPLQAYFFAPVSARSPYNQGIVQNVRQTSSGVEALSGFTDGMTAGRIADPVEVKRISKRLRLETSTNETLMPVFNELGTIVAYERSVDPRQLEKLKRDTHLAKMIGVWRGRQAEELTAGALNERLVDALKDMYDTDMKASSANKAQYINILDPDQLDAVQQDAVKLLSRDVMEYAESVFGGSGFWVRRDMFLDALGDRKASIGDAWSGNTRWSPAMQANVKNLALAFGGNEAYRRLLNSEAFIQGFVKDVRVLIVVKSVFVPMANFVSNIYQMVSRGVPMANIVRSMPKKLAEVNAYAKSQLRKIEAEADLRAAEAASNVTEARKLRTEIQSIQDAHKRLSIWPLIEAGEFSSISDVGISRDDILLTEGKLHAYMEKLTEKLPSSLQTAGRYALITKDTALFQGLQKAVEYSDFLAKAIIYDDITIRQKKTKAHALGRVTEEFVNYDRLSGRFRGYSEDMGMSWFYSFKLRSAKIAVSMIRNNPVHALMAGIIPTPPGMDSVGTPIGDNIFTKGIEGTLGYSIGPGMASGSWRLNPWVNLAY